MSSPDQSPPQPAGPRRRRWTRLVLGALGLLILLVLAAPFIAAPMVRGMVVDQGNERLEGELTLADLSFSLGGSVHAGGLLVDDELGQRVASIGSLGVEADVLAALSGSYRADVVVEDLELHVRREADGALNLGRLVKPAPAGDPSDGSGDASDAAGDPPDVSGSFLLRRGAVFVHGDGGTTQLADLTFEARLSGLDEPAPFSLTARVVGPSGEGGSVSLGGTVTAAAGGRMDGTGLSAVIEYSLEGLLLEALAPAAMAFAPVDELSGRLGATGSWTWQGGLALTGQTEWTLSGARVGASALGDRPLAIPSLSLTAQASLDGQGDGNQSLELDAGSLLALSYAGSVVGAVSDAPAVSGQLSMDGQIGELLAFAGEALSLKAGVQPAGSLQAEVDFDVALAPGELPGGRLDGRLLVDALSARDADGQAIDLGELRSIELALAGRSDPATTLLELTSLQLTAGPVQASALGRLTGFSPGGDISALEVSGGRASAEADLDRLQVLLAPLLAADAPSFGGRLSVDSTVDMTDGRLGSHSTVRAERLVVRGLPSGDSTADLGPLDLTLVQEGDFDPAPGGEARLQRLELRSEAFDIDASGTLTDAADPALRAGRVEQTLRLRPGIAATLLAPFLGGLAPEGGPVTIDQALQFEGSRLVVTSHIVAPDLTVRGGAAGEQATRVSDLSLDLTAAADLDTLALDVQELATEWSALHAEGKDLPAVTTNLEARWDPDAGQLDLASLSVTTPGLELGVSGTAGGLLALEPGGLLPRQLESDLALQLDVQPDVLGVRLAAFLGDLGLAGEPLAASFDLGTRDGRAQLSGSMTGSRLQITLPADPEAGAPARRLTQRDLELALDLEADLSDDAGALSIRELGYRSTTARASVTGGVEQLLQPEQLSADVELHVDAALARLLSDLGPVLPLEGWRGSGVLVVDGSLRGDAGRMDLRSLATITDLDLELPGAEPGSAPLAIVDDEVSFDLDAEVTLPDIDLELRQATVASVFLRGDINGRATALAHAGSGDEAPMARLSPLQGDLVYSPDALGALLAPFLPVTLSGAEEQPLAFRFEGPLASFDPAALLGGLGGNATIGLGTLEMAGVTAGGEITTALDGGLADVKGALQVLGGAVGLDARLDTRAAGSAPVTTLSITAEDVGADGRLGPLLATLHPLLAGAGDADVGTYGARLATTLELSWAGVLPLDGVLPTDLSGLTGSGLLDLQQVRLSASPLLGEMLANLDHGSEKEYALQPLAFTIEDGRVAYSEPWVWEISKVPTSFTGSVGFDAGLDLTWNVPITDKLRDRYKFLAKLDSESLAIPIRGSATDPKMQWGEVIDSLASQVVEKELQDKLDEELGGLLGGLGGLGGDGDEGDEGGADAGAEAVTPESLLAQADALWAKGDKKAAMPLYQRLKDDFKLTLVYQFNKKKIKDRAKGKD